MSNGKGSALSIIALLIGVVGMGAGGFAIYQNFTTEGPPGQDGINGIDGINGTDGVDGIDGTNTIVGIWDGLNGSGVYYNLTLDRIQYNNSDYFELTDGNESLYLTRSGWYRVSFFFVYDDIDINHAYSVIWRRNGGNDFWIADFIYPNATAVVVDTSFLVFTDGNDYFNLFVGTWGGSDWTKVSSSGSSFFVLEYVLDD